MLRPALCLATGRALGAMAESLLPTAVVLEMYHSAFLIHDDVEDESVIRRGRPTLHHAHGVPIAVHVGDAMLAATIAPLLDNVDVIGLGPSLAVLDEIGTMARRTVEGQMMELRLIESGRWDLRDATYLRLIHQKTSWYSFITPMRVGAVIARSGDRILRQLFRLGALLGAAFQLRDDVLSLEFEAAETGKDSLGDLWEGKHSLILAHALRTASADERRHALELLGRRRATPLERCMEELVAEGELSELGARRLMRIQTAVGRPRDREAVEELRRFVARRESIHYARMVSARYAAAARRAMQDFAADARPGLDLQFLHDLVDFVQERHV